MSAGFEFDAIPSIKNVEKGSSSLADITIFNDDFWRQTKDQMNKNDQSYLTDLVITDKDDRTTTQQTNALVADRQDHNKNEIMNHHEASRFWHGSLPALGFPLHEGLSDAEHDLLVKRLSEDSPIASVTNQPDGSTTKLQDNTLIMRTNDGVTSIVASDGRSLVIRSDGTRMENKANGDESVVNPDGSGYFTLHGQREEIKPI